MDWTLLKPLAISLGLGLLVGLQREWRESEIAGIRTFPLFTLSGTLAAFISEMVGPWLVAAGLLSIASLLVVGNIAKLNRDHIDPGLTTEAAALVMYLVGAALGFGITVPAIVIGGVVAVLLHWKRPLHLMVANFREGDLRAVTHLVLIALVILPLLPDQTFGWYDVLNPYEIWRMVVLIVGISMAAYVAYKVVGARAGSVLGGVLGGLISSTATTVSYARQSKSNAGAAPVAALVILLASTVVNARVLLEIGVVAPALLPAALPPLTIMLGVMSLLAVILFLRTGDGEAANPFDDNPAQLQTALIFGALYAVILFVVAAAKEQFGSEALYAVALISGLTDVDAITLSTAKLAQQDRVATETAWRVILVATLSNLAFKGVSVAVLGSRRLLLYIAALFGISMVCGGLVLAFWPDWTWNLSPLDPQAK